MNLYLISNNFKVDYGMYDSAVVAAETKEEARQISPHSGPPLLGKWYNEWNPPTWIGEWVPDLKYVEVKLVGIAVEGTKKGTVICSSFNAG